MKRRIFLQLLGLFSSAGVLSACGSDTGSKELISGLVPPEDGVIPGETLWYPSTCTECPAHCGISVRVRERWPVKLEGISGHPINAGGLCARGQASISRLYHPDRIKSPLRRSPAGQWQKISWEEAYKTLAGSLEKNSAKGKNVFLSARTTGTLAPLIKSFCEQLGIERLPDFEPYAHSALRLAYQELFGSGDIPFQRFSEADFFLSIGADFLETFVSPVAYADQFAKASANPSFHWVHAEPHASLTGFKAHERLVIHPGSEVHLLIYLFRNAKPKADAQALHDRLLNLLPAPELRETALKTGLPDETLTRLAEAMGKAKKPLVSVGGVALAQDNALSTALLCVALQGVTGMTDDVVDFSAAENYTGVGSLLDMQKLQSELETGKIATLFLTRCNPVRQLSSRSGFAEALEKAAFRVVLSDFLDETAKTADLVLPLSHSLESWGDARPRRDVTTIIRPAVQPLHDTRSEGDILLGFMQWKNEPAAGSPYQEYLFSEWARKWDRTTLQIFAEKGFLVERAPKTKTVLDPEKASAAFTNLVLAAPPEGTVLIVTPSVRKFDGRSDFLTLLSEIPDPLTTVTYGEWLSVSPALAKKLKIRDRDRVRLTATAWKAEFAAKIQPGLAAGVVMLQKDMLGAIPWPVEKLSGEAIACLKLEKIEKPGGRIGLPIMAGSVSQTGRGIIPAPISREEHEKHKRLNLYPEPDYPQYRWAMGIDLNLCTGCGACAAACYVENSVPLVGPQEHLKGREMSWLRIEPFYSPEGKLDFLPMLCQQCDYAPCEPVCPVFASLHNSEGLNLQVYNRCVGTRYCANNCPYKVRRFNWFTHSREGMERHMLNPDLAPRTKGMMEKCTFCIQRIRIARDRAKDEKRLIRDGEVMPACAQSCPTGAIVFGNLLDKGSKISALVKSEQAYRVFEELGTDPAVYYLHKNKRKHEGQDSES